MSMLLDSEDTWPAEVLTCLHEQSEALMAYEDHEEETRQAYVAPKARHIPMALMPSNPHHAERERVLASIVRSLQAYTLRGWHCTRLTDAEVSYIEENGMQPPNWSVLKRRIDALQIEGVISPKMAERLKVENEADAENRHGRIWFAFFSPRLGGQTGIERFFRRWGGEALYNSHEQDPETGGVLARIGRPCLVQADVVISTLSYQRTLAEKVARCFLAHRGLEAEEPSDHEDNTRAMVPPEQILRFVFHGSQEFADLTGCDDWKPPLT